MRTLPALGDLLGKGSFAAVFAVAGDPSVVVKRTECSASKVLLKKMLQRPVPGMPAVLDYYGDSGPESFFLLERLRPVSLLDSDVNLVLSSIEKAQLELDFSIENGFDDGEVSLFCAKELAAKGLPRLASAFEWLAGAFENVIDGGLDVRLPNLMRTATNELVLSDPVREL